jgi:hypothetical protein
LRDQRYFLSALHLDMLERFDKNCFGKFEFGA